ncbi:MAG: primase protein [Candidatus Magasanikbacteria bacterium GW2011_GWC2_37_14]|uniref:DNA primase n=1 Tax=Candidatus Magasanikbacteria bacterium GW2011_GWC2_37_14 TaxID=1619046 RepID=A0A0G0JJE9_9BACT|nr:MAG: primase protein [Candidatus Magasanikbacteria bacterium GW2011_GWC2_37_14]
MSDEVQLIKNKIDVAELVGEYVQLKPAGTNKKGLCPFHHEKSPSFMVSSERGSWHCFGCAKGGDIFSFIQEIEGMEFKESLKYLADKAGVTLTSSYKNEADSSQKNRIKNINSETARFFHNFLLKMPTAKLAMDYLLNRGLKIETIEEWQIGFIPEQWDLLTQYLLKKGFAIDDLVAAGITIKREGADEQTGRGFYDRFRGRIMFPIWNVHDEVVGFTGRILVEKPDSAKATPGKENFTPGKYVNTPQTGVYDKSRVIFGLNKAKQTIKAKNLIVMVEGQMDVIACHQAGMKNVVASSGTALTEEQVKLLKRYASVINMAFDADEAGQNAAKRGISIALAEGLSVKVIRIPDGAGKDPDECLKKSPEVWFKAVEQAQNVMDWYLEKVLRGRDIFEPRQKQLVVNEYLGEIALIPYAVERDHWLKILGDKLGVDVSVLREDLAQIKTNTNKKPGVTSGQSLASIPQVLAPQNKGKFELLVERLLSLLLRFPILKNEVNSGIQKILLATAYSALYEIVKNSYNVNEVVTTDSKDNLLDILLLQGEWEFAEVTENTAKKELENISEMVHEEWIKKRRRELQKEIELAQKNNEQEKMKTLSAEFVELGN